MRGMYHPAFGSSWNNWIDNVNRQCCIYKVLPGTIWWTYHFSSDTCFTWKFLILLLIMLNTADTKDSRCEQFKCCRINLLLETIIPATERSEFSTTTERLLSSVSNQFILKGFACLHVSIFSTLQNWVTFTNIDNASDLTSTHKHHQPIPRLKYVPPQLPYVRFLVFYAYFFFLKCFCCFISVCEGIYESSNKSA